MANGEKQTVCIRRKNSSADAEPLTSGVHNTPMKELFINAVIKSGWL